MNWELVEGNLAKFIHSQFFGKLVYLDIDNPAQFKITLIKTQSEDINNPGVYINQLCLDIDGQDMTNWFNDASDEIKFMLKLIRMEPLGNLSINLEIYTVEQIEPLYDFLQAKLNLSNKWIAILKSLNYPRQKMLIEQNFSKQLIQALNAESFPSLLRQAKDMCAKPHRKYARQNTWDAVFILAKACMDKALFVQAYQAFSEIDENNYYHKQSCFEMNNLYGRCHFESSVILSHEQQTRTVNNLMYRLESGDNSKNGSMMMEGLLSCASFNLQVCQDIELSAVRTAYDSLEPCLVQAASMHFSYDPSSISGLTVSSMEEPVGPETYKSQPKVK